MNVSIWPLPGSGAGGGLKARVHSRPASHPPNPVVSVQSRCTCNPSPTPTYAHLGQVLQCAVYCCCCRSRF